jgi:hypothetical protein
MLNELPRNPVPTWLANIRAEDEPPISCLLDRSVYYPACGVDGRPVQYLAGYSHSFIYADYGRDSEKVIASLTADCAFLDYQVKFARHVDPLVFLGTSTGNIPGLNERIDGIPRRYADVQVSLYAFWSVFERLPSCTEAHGPELFSLLYLANDGVATYHALYHSNGLYPSVVAIIQPGEGFGGNWTSFFEPSQIFARTVMANPHGRPSYLLLGGYGADREFQQTICWPGYELLEKFWKTTDGYLGLWKSVEQ